MRSVAWLMGLTAIASAVGCDVVIGTEDLFACEDETCEGTGGGGAGSTNSSTGSGSTSTGTSVASGSSTGSASGCWDLTVNVLSQNLEVKLENAQDEDFYTGSRTVCVLAGTQPFEAECADGANKGDPVAVTWGGSDCQDGASCNVSVTAPLVLNVAYAAGASCP